MPGARRTRSLACDKNKAHERSHHRYSRDHPAFPHAMVLRLISRSPRRRIRLVTVVSGLLASLSSVNGGLRYSALRLDLPVLTHTDIDFQAQASYTEVTLGVQSDRGE